MSQMYMRFPGGKKKALTLSYDDGVEQDIRLIGIMQKCGLKGTFNLNSGLYAPEGTVYPAGQIHRRMTGDQTLGLYRESGMEVAAHGLTHLHMEKLSPARCMYEVMKDRENLEEQFSTIVRGMAYPYGTYNDRVVEILRDAGIVYCRTVAATENFDIPADWLRLAATCHHGDPKLMELARRFVMTSPAGDPWLFYLWGHSYEFEMNDNWNVIEEFAAYVGGREDIWYATNIEVHDYVEAYRSMAVSADGRRVYNPSAYPLYYEKDGKTASLAPGEGRLMTQA